MEIIHEFIECTSLAEFNSYVNTIETALGISNYQKPVKHKTENKWLLEIPFNMRSEICEALGDSDWSKRTGSITYQDTNYYITDTKGMY